MRQLEVLQRSDFEEVWKIMRESFPADERRERAGQEALVTEPDYHLYGIREEGVPAAFADVWEFAEFSFLEHFAVEQGRRNGGLGAGLLRQLTGRVRLPLILEAEPPETEIAARRIAFYRREGFALNGYEYIQPAMSRTGRAIPLVVMSFPDPVNESRFQEIRAILYRRVYRVTQEEGAATAPPGA